MKNQFIELASVDCSEHVEQKGKFTYLSWSFAVNELCKLHPCATWETIRFDGMPYLKTEFGVFVEVAVTVGSVTRSQIHPVLDGRNRPISQPDAFHINTSIQRALVKAIALHGLGLYIYGGEDLPTESIGYTDEQHEIFLELIKADNALGIYALRMEVGDKTWVELFNSGEKGHKVKMKDHVRKLEKEGSNAFLTTLQIIEDAVDQDNGLALREIWDELSSREQRLLWNATKDHHATITTILENTQ